MILALSLIALALAAVPCGLFLVNRRLLREPGMEPGAAAVSRSVSLSVLIPARNEEANIEDALIAVLASRGVQCEVLVLDDGSEDRTSGIVRELASRDARVKLHRAPPLPHGWAGKQHACHVLAGLAKHPILVFLDADVRLAPDALFRLAKSLEETGASLVSGVPRQITVTWAERLLIPLVHFILLGFLPLRRMRRSLDPAYGAGCGQLFCARAEAYFAAGGHAGIRESWHDGLRLPRAFRRAGFHTDLVDVTRLARCRMYASAREVWRGLGKNAVEGLASPRLIVPMTMVLAMGQVAPWVLLGFSLTRLPECSWAAGTSALAVVLSLIPRLLAAPRFKTPLMSALAHPAAVILFLAIQWQAWARHVSGRRVEWKGRASTGGVGASVPAS